MNSNRTELTQTPALTVSEVAARLNCHEQTVRAAIRTGEITATGGGRGRPWLIPPSEAQRLRTLMRERRPGRPRKTPSNLSGAELRAWELYRAEINEIAERDFRQKIDRLCRAYRELEAGIRTYEDWLASGRDRSEFASAARTVNIGPLRDAIDAAVVPIAMPRLSLTPNPGSRVQLMAEVHRLRLAGLTFPVIAGRIHKSVKWAQELEKQWKQLYGDPMRDRKEGK